MTIWEEVTEDMLREEYPMLYLYLKAYASIMKSYKLYRDRQHPNTLRLHIKFNASKLGYFYTEEEFKNYLRDVFGTDDVFIEWYKDFDLLRFFPVDQMKIN